MLAASATPDARSGYAVVAQRALQRRIQGANKVQNRAERTQRVSQNHGAEPDDAARHAPFVNLSQSRNHAQYERDDRVEARLASENLGRRDRRAAILAELRAGDDDRLAASRTETRLIELRIRHGR